MYSILKKHFIFRQSSGKTWNFFWDPKEGLCYSILKSKNNWTIPFSIDKSALEQFHADMDQEDRFHLLYQNSDGNIFYCLLEGDSLRITEVLKSRTPASYDKSLRIIALPHIVYFFYILRHGEKLLLSYQTLSDGTISSPKAIDYVSPESNTYSLAYDKTGLLYIFYVSFNNGIKKLGYKVNTMNQPGWGEFVNAADGNYDFGYPRIIIDPKNTLHLLFQRNNEDRFDLVYRQKISGRSLWSNETVIHTSSVNFAESSPVFINGSLTIYWVRSDVVSYSHSSDAGATWSRPSRHSFFAGRQLFCISYKSCVPEEMEKLAVQDLPGSYLNGLRLAFYQIPQESITNISAEDLRSMIVDSLQMLKTSVEELKLADSRINSDIAELKRTVEDLRIQLDKFTIRLEMMNKK